MLTADPACQCDAQLYKHAIPLQSGQSDRLLSRAYTFISLFVTRYLHTQPFHKMCSIALKSLFLAHFALFSGG